MILLGIFLFVAVYLFIIRRVIQEAGVSRDNAAIGTTSLEYETPEDIALPAPDPPLSSREEVVSSYTSELLTLAGTVSDYAGDTFPLLRLVEDRLLSVRVPGDARDGHLSLLLRIQAIDPSLDITAVRQQILGILNR